jgi:predicted metal-dependent hydrolase
MIEAVAAHEPDADPYAEIRLLEKQIEELRQELTDLIEDMRDWEDGGAATRLVEEQEAVIEALERRRSELLERLGQTRSR